MTNLAASKNLGLADLKRGTLAGISGLCLPFLLCPAAIVRLKTSPGLLSPGPCSSASHPDSGPHLLSLDRARAYPGCRQQVASPLVTYSQKSAAQAKGRGRITWTWSAQCMTGQVCSVLGESGACGVLRLGRVVLSGW